MIGISEELQATLSERYSEREIAELFGPHAYKGEVRVVYQRGDQVGDRTSPLPSSRHMQYVAKGWTAVAIADPPASVEHVEITVPTDILEHARHDRVAIWQRGAEHIESSCRNAQSLLAKGWTFAGLADAERHRAVAEARPHPTVKASAPAPVESSKRK